MNTIKSKNCLECDIKFIITDDDLKFYERMSVPPPNICHECRQMERCAVRNESTLYGRKCDLSGKDIISLYSEDSPFVVYDQHAWWSDEWDPMGYGREYDFNRPFFEQYKELMARVPRLSIINKKSVKSDYCNYSLENKNCYLCFGGHYNEDCGYSWFTWKDKECYDCLRVLKSELSYECNFADNLYKCMFLEYSFDCVECAYGYDLRGCQNCTLSTGLRNKQYCFMNKQYSKEEYMEKVSELVSGSYEKQCEALVLFKALKLKTIRASSYQKNCTGCVGDELENCKNLIYGFNGENSEDCKYAYHLAETYSSMDTTKMGYDRSDFVYQATGCAGLNNCKFVDSCWNNNDLSYCNLCFSSGNLFGCIGLRHKKYCVLNKQYTEEVYKNLLPKIIRHMSDVPYNGRDGRMYKYGDFFPRDISPFGYNETTAQEFFPKSEKDAENAGYKWKPSKERWYKITKKPEELPDTITDTEEGITKEVIGCAHMGKCAHQCITAFKITPAELQFYRKIKVPLPRLCHNCRHNERLSARNPMRLWKRKCQNEKGRLDGHTPCSNEFETSYAPGRGEVVYCMECYRKKVS
jgi:hypothetical protein